MKITRCETRYYEEDVPADLKGFLSWTFTSGSQTGQDYILFDKLFVKYILELVKPLGLRVCNYSKGHYYSSGFVTDGDKKFVYFSISDVRFFKGEWHDRILIRTAEHDHDWTGGRNQYTNLKDFAQDVKNLMG